MLCCSHCIMFVLWTCILPYVIVLHWLHVRMIICLLCDHCSHFYMTVLVYDQVALMFHIMFTWLQFTCYIILVLSLLALPWGSNVFYPSVSGYRYLYSKFITAPMIHDRGSDMIREVLYVFYTHVVFVSF